MHARRNVRWIALLVVIGAFAAAPAVALADDLSGMTGTNTQTDVSGDAGDVGGNAGVDTSTDTSVSVTSDDVDNALETLNASIDGMLSWSDEQKEAAKAAVAAQVDSLEASGDLDAAYTLAVSTQGFFTEESSLAGTLGDGFDVVVRAVAKSAASGESADEIGAQLDQVTSAINSGSVSASTGSVVSWLNRSESGREHSNMLHDKHDATVDDDDGTSGGETESGAEAGDSIGAEAGADASAHGHANVDHSGKGQSAEHAHGAQDQGGDDGAETGVDISVSGSLSVAGGN